MGGAEDLLDLGEEADGGEPYESQVNICSFARL
jgi:hypothetical protein